MNRQLAPTRTLLTACARIGLIALPYLVWSYGNTLDHALRSLGPRAQARLEEPLLLTYLLALAGITMAVAPQVWRGLRDLVRMLRFSLAQLSWGDGLEHYRRLEQQVEPLLALDPSTDSAQTALRQALHDPSPYVRWRALEILAPATSSCPRLTALVLDHLRYDDTADVRIVAAEALGTGGHPALRPRTLNELRRALTRDASSGVRSAAAAALAKSPALADTVALVHAWRDEDCPSVRHALRAAIIQHPDAIPHLLAVVRDSTVPDHPRYDAVIAICSILMAHPELPQDLGLERDLRAISQGPAPRQAGPTVH